MRMKSKSAYQMNTPRRKFSGNSFLLDFGSSTPRSWIRLDYFLERTIWIIRMVTNLAL